MRMRVLKLQNCGTSSISYIASYADACIETTTKRWKGMTQSIASYADARIEIEC